MIGSDILRLIEQMRHEKNIDRDVIFDGIEDALQSAAQKHFGEDEEISVTIDRETGEITVKRGDEPIDPEVLGRISAQIAKNVIIQKIREAESTSVYNEFAAMKGDLVVGTVQRIESRMLIVSVGRSEAILPRSEQIPGESFHVGERIKAVVLEVKRNGQRVKIVLSRTHPDFVRRLFEEEIPEIQDRIIEIKAVAREAGYRTKIAVSSIDLKVDCVGACVGVRGSRIKNIVDELGGERIDIVRWNDSLQVMIPNALQPAEVEDVFVYTRPGRAIVLVPEDQLSLAIGRRGQNVRLASKLVGWDIEVMTHEELGESLERAMEQFLAIPGVNEELADAFIEEGLTSYLDLSNCDPEELAEFTGIPVEQAEAIIDFAEHQVELQEQEEELERQAAEARALAGITEEETEQPQVSSDETEEIAEDIEAPVIADEASKTSEVAEQEPSTGEEVDASQDEASSSEDAAVDAVSHEQEYQEGMEEAEMLTTESAQFEEPETEDGVDADQQESAASVSTEEKEPSV